MRHPSDVVARTDHAFGEEEPDRQLAIMARSPHGDGERLPRGADLERLLENDVVERGRLRRPARHAADLPASDALHVSRSLRPPSSST